MTMTASRGAAGARDLPFTFWLINGLQALERAAFFGVVAVLGIYMVESLGFSGAQAGAVFLILFPLTYLVPAFAGAFADKVGVRLMLCAAFATQAVGHILVGVSTSLVGMLLAVAVLGAGAGMFRPLAPAVIAQSTPVERRNFGFAIYYWGINLGAFLAPLAIALTLPVPAFRLVFFAAAGVVALNLVLTLAFFRNVEAPRPATRSFATFRGLGVALRDARFVVLLALLSGFWFMWSVNSTFLPLFVRSFVVLPPWFQIAAIKSINPAAILVLAPLVSPRLTGRASLPTMIVGVAIVTCGMFVIAFVPGFWPLAMAIVILSLGELLTQPMFLAHVSKSAPPERLSAYMGCAFLPIGVGFGAGSLAQGFMYDAFLVRSNAPSLFWAIIASIGLTTLAALIVYHRRVTSRPPPRRILAPRVLVPLLLLLAPALIVAAALRGPGPFAEDDPGAPAGSLVVALPTIGGQTDEGDAWEGELSFPENARGDAIVVLAWSDEAAPVPAAANAPDRFRLTLTPPDADAVVEEAANAPGAPGAIEITLPIRADGVWRIRVELLDAGDVGMPLGPGVVADTGNAWTLTPSYEIGREA